MFGFTVFENPPTEEVEPAADPVQTGFIAGGCASAPTGTNQWSDRSQGVSYGEGERYANMETPFMTRVAGKKR